MCNEKFAIFSYIKEFIYMIRKNMKALCSEDPSLIENYDKAVADTENLWVCHHRLELDEEGKTVHSKQELIDMGMYWKRPASELIFLTVSDHMALHMNDEVKEKLSRLHKKLWRNPKRKRIMREKAQEKREQGLTLTGIEQNASTAAYREYQKLQHRDWYKRNKDRWNAYNYRRRLMKLTDQELQDLYDKHANSIIIAIQTGFTDRIPKLEKHNASIQAEMDRRKEEKNG